MKVAVIEETDKYQNELKRIAQENRWQIDFFEETADFGRANLPNYDVIISDYNLPSMSGQKFIKSIASKTKAQIFLMSENNCYTEEDIHNNKIKGFINKEDINDFVEKLKYIDVKLRINNIMEEEKDKLGEFVPVNGYFLEKKDDTLIVCITSLLTQKSKIKLSKEISESNVNKVIVYFKRNGLITSPYLSLLVYLYKLTTSFNMKMAFWNFSHDEDLKKQIDICNLSKLFPIYNNLENAIEY